MTEARPAPLPVVGLDRYQVRFESPLLRRVVVGLFAVLAGTVCVVNLSSGWRVIPMTAMVLVLGHLSAVDLAEHRLANREVVPLIALSYVSVLADGVVGASSLSAAIAHVAVGGTAAAVLLILQFGLGDVKLMLAIGTMASWLGPPAVSWTVLVAAATGGLAATVMMVAFRRVRLDFGFGPFLALGSVAGMIAAGVAS